MKILRITVCVDAFGLACGGGWEWNDAHGKRLAITAWPYGKLENRLVRDVASELAFHAMKEAGQQLALF